MIAFLVIASLVVRYLPLKRMKQESITLQISPQKEEQIYDLSGKKVISTIH